MFIVPISSTFKVSDVGWGDRQAVGGGQSAIDNSFKDIVQGLIDNVQETEAQTKIDSYNLSIGNMDDMHTMIINATKAEVALQTMVELRNKMLDAYSEVMRTNL